MKKILFSTGIGLGLGLIMSILVLYMMTASIFTVQSLAFVISLIAVCAFPLCAGVVRKYEEISVLIIQIVMILTSFVITLIYGSYVGHSEALTGIYNNLFLRVLLVSSLQHGIALITVLISAGIHKLYEKKS
jgi:hypothetical protein